MCKNSKEIQGQHICCLISLEKLINSLNQLIKKSLSTCYYKSFDLIEQVEEVFRHFLTNFLVIFFHNILYFCVS